MSTELEAYSVVAYNTARDSENKIHDNTVARRFGFSGGLVPGVDVYAYMAHLPVARWGRDFLQHGTLQARFLKPVYDGETAIVSAAEANGGLDIAVKSRDELCATGHAAMTRTPPPALDAFEETAAVAERSPADEASLASVGASASSRCASRPNGPRATSRTCASAIRSTSAKACRIRASCRASSTGR